MYWAKREIKNPLENDDVNVKCTYLFMLVYIKIIIL